jgi:hypothetical protein
VLFWVAQGEPDVFKGAAAMIRFNKAVKIMEWGEGTNSTNQRWEEIAEGTFKTREFKDGITILTIQTKNNVAPKNQKDNTVKLCQQGEGTTANSEFWGEVASGNVTSITGNLVVVEISQCVKISGAANPVQRFFNVP